MKTKYLLILLSFYCSVNLNAQVESYQKVFAPEIKTCMGTLLDSLDQASLLLGKAIPGSNLSVYALHYLEDYDPELDIQSSSYLYFDPNPGFPLNSPWVIRNLVKKVDNKVFFSTQGLASTTLISYFNENTLDSWIHNPANIFNGLPPVNGFSTQSFSITDSGIFQLFKNDGVEKKVYQAFISEDGEVQSTKVHTLDITGERFAVVDAIYNKQTQTTLLICDTNPFDPTDTILESYVLEIDESGEILKAKRIEGLKVSQLIIDDVNGGYYICGESQEYIAISGNASDMALLKLDQDLNVQWSDVYYGDYFDFKRCTIQLLPNGDIVLAYSTFGAFPVILARVDVDRSVLWEKGYPLFEPEIDVASDGSLYLTSNYSFDDSGDLYQEVTLCKTDTLGDISNCEVFPSCLQKAVIKLSAADFVYQTEELNTIVPNYGELSFEPVQIESAYACNIPPSPRPIFELPDTLCIESEVSLENLANLHAHGIEWTVSESGNDSLWVDSLSFNYSFDQVGAYTVKQSVWFLGCRHDHEELVYVLNEPIADIEIAEGDTCQGPPLQLAAYSDQPIDMADWGDGQHSETFWVEESGQYAVRISNGYCETVDSMDIYFVVDDVEQLYTLPADTVLCADELPYLLIPQSDSTLLYNMGGEGDTLFNIYNAGNYLVEATLRGCTYEKDFNLTVQEACPLEIYIPNVFSPNSDGVNDLFRAYGDSFALLDMKIFDRWGTCLYQNSGESAVWDGRSEGKKLGAGNYVYLISVENFRTGQIEEYRGNVMLFR